MMKIDKIFGDKKGNSVIYILLAVGILLLVMGNGWGRMPSGTSIEASRDELSKQTEQVLSEIKGVGKVSVMISYDCGEKKESVFSSGSDKNAVSGVLIVADGGADGIVREKIVRAARAALGVEPHKIEVFERKERQ